MIGLSLEVLCIVLITFPWCDFRSVCVVALVGPRGFWVFNSIVIVLLTVIVIFIVLGIVFFSVIIVLSSVRHILACFMSWGLGFTLFRHLVVFWNRLLPRGLFLVLLSRVAWLGRVGVLFRLLVGLLAVVIAVFVLTPHIYWWIIINLSFKTIYRFLLLLICKLWFSKDLNRLLANSSKGVPPN